MRVMLIIERPAFERATIEVKPGLFRATASNSIFAKPMGEWPQFKRVDVVYVPLPYQAP